MTKAIDETWRVGNRVPRHIYRGDGPGDVVGTLDREEDARIAAAAPEALRLLLEAELYATKHGNTACCPWCSGGEPYHGEKYQHATHAEGCEWLRIMRKAGLR